MWSNIKAVVAEYLSSENVYIYTYIRLTMIMMNWLCTYWPTIKQTSLNKATSKQKLFKK